MNLRDLLFARALGGSSGVVDLMLKITTGELTEVNDPISTTVKDYAYPNFNKLTSVSIPNSNTTGNSAFRNNPNLTIVNLQNAKTVGSYSFHTDTALERIDFPLVETIMDGAFGYCSKLRALILRVETVCSLKGSTNVFIGTPIANGTGYVYVPASLVDSYKSATNWSAYASQIRAIEDYPEITGV